MKEFLTARTTHRERGIGIERAILEDDLGAMGAIAYVEFFLFHIVGRFLALELQKSSIVG